MNWTDEHLQEKLKENTTFAQLNQKHTTNNKPKKHKYNAVRTEVDGIIFASKAEAERYGELIILKLAGVVKDFELQPKFDIGGGVKYIADFKVYYPDGHFEIEDVKGFETKEFKIKAKLFREKYPDIKLNILKGDKM